MSNVNAPMQALVMLRIPRELRTQGVAAFGVFQCIGAPIGLILATMIGGYLAAGYFYTASDNDENSVLAVTA